MVYVGAYLYVLSPFTETVIDLCQEHESGDGAFCSECGRGESTRRHKRTYVKLYEWMEAHEDVLVDVSCEWSLERVRGMTAHVLISNQQGSGLNVSRRASGLLQELPTAYDEKLTLLARHQTAIDELRAAGCEVEVKQGVLAWHS